MGWNGNIAKVTDGRTTLYLTSLHVGSLIVESPLWETLYLPEFSLRGSTVLDIGAGCGETAHFFFKHSASKVVCVESDKEACALLRKNASINGWNVEIFGEPFRPNHLSISHDFMKMDIEGGETELLSESVRKVKPCRMELHEKFIGHLSYVQIIKKFRLKHIGDMVWGAD